MLPDRPSSRPALPAAVSTLVAAVVQGEPVDATVVAAHRYALYLSVQGSVLPVVTSDAVALPTAVRLAVASGALSRGAIPGADRARPWGVAAGDVVRVGAGRITLPGIDVVAARTWRPARVRPADRPRVGCSDGRQGSHFSTQLLDRFRVGCSMSPGQPLQHPTRGERGRSGARVARGRHPHRVFRSWVLRRSPGQPPEHPTRRDFSRRVRTWLPGRPFPHSRRGGGGRRRAGRTRSRVDAERR